MIIRKKNMKKSVNPLFFKLKKQQFLIVYCNHIDISTSVNYMEFSKNKKFVEVCFYLKKVYLKNEDTFENF